MQRLNERVSPTRALHQDNTLTRSLIKTTLAFGHATRTTFNLQPWPLATLREQPSTFNLGLWPRYANNLQPWPLATLREQPSLRQSQRLKTFNFQLLTFNFKQIQTLVNKS
ncbi:MAG: hypothetical protein F6K26_22870 [Moorea sp. SIO2I5]|nr:hypothetical protein [Moorena sp. SIO2I5]